MITRRTFTLAVLTVVASAPVCVNADLAPNRGTFSGYFFLDRWGQGVFGVFFVEPQLARDLSKREWGPIRLTSNDIRQPMNPGAAMIHQIENVESLPEPELRIRLSIDRRTIQFAGHTKLRLTVENMSDRAVELRRGSFWLAVTVRTRGTHPQREVDRDETYDCFNNPYGMLHGSTAVIRATMTCALLTNQGEIQMRSGAPVLMIRTHGVLKIVFAGTQHEQWPDIAAGESLTCTYTIGTGWLVNEYELQVKYLQGEKREPRHIVSRAESFDVTEQE
jgi:hypothetical protein